MRPCVLRGFGYELDPTALTAAERAEVAAQIAFYRSIASVFQRGRFVRLESPFEADGNEIAWMVVRPDRRRAIVGFFRASTGRSGRGPAAPPRSRPGARLSRQWLAGDRGRSSATTPACGAGTS